ncbi:putative UPF0481 protein [Tanacetum coccineum]
MSNINNKQPQDLTDYDGISQSDVTTKNLSNSDEASTHTPIFDRKGFLEFLEILTKVHSSLSCRRKYSTQEETLEACLLNGMWFLRMGVGERRVGKESYGGMIEKYSDDEVATMMVIDGCFILEFCLKFEDEMLSKMQHLRIAKDLILLENQVPFLVLQALFDLSMGKVSFTLSKLVVVKPSNPICALISKLAAAKLLNPIRALISNPEDKKGTKNTPRAFHSIVELDRSGVHFKSYQGKEWSMTIKFQSSLFAYLPWFWSKPTLLMPTLVIHDFTELILRNLIAYEQSFPQDRYYFTSYAHAMDMLINTQEDVAKLVESKVFVNILGSNQEAADMINKTCKNIILTDFYYDDEFKQIDKYYNAFWPKHMAWLRRVYFNNPWNSIALLAAIMLFTLTVGMPSQSAESSISDFVGTTLEGRRRFRNVNPEATYVEAGEKNDNSDIPAPQKRDRRTDSAVKNFWNSNTKKKLLRFQLQMVSDQEHLLIKKRIPPLPPSFMREYFDPIFDKT